MCEIESLANETWKDVVGFEGLYKVSSLGRVYSVPRERISKSGHRNVVYGGFLSLQTIKKGYLRIGLSKDDKHYNFLVHRLVAMAFIPNPNNYPQINHKNSDKSDNRVENLEWCTNEYNYHYGDRIKSFTRSYGVPVAQYTKDGKLVKEYEYASLAERETGISVHNILAVVVGKKKPCRNGMYTPRTAGGFVWRRIGDKF